MTGIAARRNHGVDFRTVFNKQQNLASIHAIRLQRILHFAYPDPVSMFLHGVTVIHD
jgi:hypothetical protein